jgi:uncharacterized repeat protein (TIGR02543 family)
MIDRNSTKKIKIIGKLVFSLVLFVFFAGLVFSCRNPVNPVSEAQPEIELEPGILYIQLGDEGFSRSVLPQTVSLSDLDYSILLTRSGFDDQEFDSLVAADFSGGYAVADLALGEWTLTVNGYMGGETDPSFQAQTLVSVEEGGSSVSVTLEALQIGDGDLDFAVSWPAEQVDEVKLFWTDSIASLPGSELSMGIGVLAAAANSAYVTNTTNGTLQLQANDLASDSYYLTVRLLRDSVVVARILEAVEVYDGQTSEKSIVLDVGDFSQPPSAPTTVTFADYSRGVGETLESVQIDWSDQANNETAYYVYRSLDGSPYTDISGALAANSETYTDTTIDISSLASGDSVSYRIFAENDFGLSDAGEASKLVYSLSCDENGADSGTEPDVILYFSDEQASLPSNSGSLAKTGYLFGGWNTQADGDGTAYSEGQAYTMSGSAVVFYADWQDYDYLVSFGGNGASVAASPAQLHVVSPNTTVGSLPTPPQRAGWDFGGWWTEQVTAGEAPGSGSAFTAATVVDASSTVYALWNSYSHTVTYDSQGADVAANPVEQTVSSPAVNVGSLPTPPTKAGNTFAGWYTQTNGGGSGFTASTTVSGDITLYAFWSAVPTYTVSFDSNGGTAVDPQTVQESASAVEPAPESTRTGYSFDAWYSDAGLTTIYDFADPVTSAFTLYAKWIANDYTLSFVPQGGNAQVAKTVTYDSTYGSLPVPVRSGYSFNGWYTASTGGSIVEAATTVSVASDHSVYAQWTAEEYTVSFNSQGGDAQTSINVTYNTSYASLPTPVRSGYSFNGWYTASTGGTLVQNATVLTTASDHTLYAQWTAVDMTVTFNADGGSTPDPTSKTVSFDSTYGSLATTSRTGFTFSGWRTAVDGGGSLIESSTLVTEVSDHMLYAHWTAEEFTVSFDAQGGNAQSDITVQFGEEYGALPSPSRTGYSFNGWYTASSGGTLVESTTIVSTSADHSLYAQWTAISSTVTFDADGGSEPAPVTSKSVSYDANYGTLPTSSRTGYSFSGWRTAADGGGTLVESTTTVTAVSDHTLYAHWEPNTYSVSFSAQGGTTANPAFKMVDYANTYGTLATTSRTGYTFSGWFTQTGGAGTEITDASTMNTAANHTLYAYWVANDYTVSYETYGGSTHTSDTVTFDDTYGTLPTPTRSGWTFGGWGTSAYGAGTEITAGSTVSTAADHTLYAQWTATVTFDDGGGTGLEFTSVELEYPDLIVEDLPTPPTKSNYSFVGWSTQASGGTTFTATSEISGSMTVYPHWVNLEVADMYPVPGGTFTQTDSDGNSFSHTISPYSMGRYLVTYELWYDVKEWGDSNGYSLFGGREGGELPPREYVYGSSPSSRGQEPVTEVSWRDVVIWANAYSEKMGYDPVYRDGSGDIVRTVDESVDSIVEHLEYDGFRLPSEGEWLFAASYIDGSSWTSETYASGATSADSADVQLVAWFVENAETTTHTVGQKTANALGLYDMSGNVHEYCWDWLGAWPVTAQTDYRGPGSSETRVRHGGGWFSELQYLQLGYRFGAFSDVGDLEYGFRLVR